ncbi:hypothetical protein DKL61_08865 [Gammaproteobacteria bacterium ESL0073]|nr:hypothetical protein DKL61_08865 [Gammaproteobacteria bacterium ESL0073]
MSKKLTLLIGLTCFLFLTGCNKLTQENYNKLQMGMERSKVESIFGKPSDCQNIMSATSCNWSQGDASLKIQFVDNKVVTYFANNIK